MLGPPPDELWMSTSGVLDRAVAAGFFTDGDQMGSKTRRTVPAQSIFLYWDVTFSVTLVTILVFIIVLN